MEISFRKAKVEKFFLSQESLVKKYGESNAKKLARSFMHLEASPSLQDVPPAIRPHPLKNNLKGCFAVDGKHPYRIVFVPKGDYDPQNISTIREI